MKVKIYKQDRYIVAASFGVDVETAFYLYLDDEIIERVSYHKSNAHVFKVDTPGEYRVKCFSVNSVGEKVRAWSETVSVTIDDFIAHGEKPKLRQHRESWDEWLSLMPDYVYDARENWYILEPKSYTAERIMAIGWQLSRYPALNPTAGIDWVAPGVENRSWGFHLHAWEFIDPVMKEYAVDKDPEKLRWMADAALNWWHSSREIDDERSMVWYDMSLSLRAPRLARLIHILVKAKEEHTAKEFIPAAISHLEHFFEEKSFNPNNNHGFFTAASSIDFAKLLPMLPYANELRELGRERMKTMTQRQFGADGGHLEHSPDYHRMLLESFEKGLRAGLIEDPEIAERIGKAAEVLGWMVQPDGNLVQFGDSPSFDVKGSGLTSVDSHTQFILTDGHEGVPNDEELCVLNNSGYAFVRSPQPRSVNERIYSSYLAFQAGFHSRAHKHADDLTFTWFDFGKEIIVDSGRYGYEQLLPPDAPERLQGFYYGAPERMYVEGTIAHNTVAVGDENIERRARKPYGSALGNVSHADGCFTLEADVDHGKYVHQRRISLEPKRRLEVVDMINAAESTLDAVAWFNIDGQWELSVESNELIMHHPDENVCLRVSGSGKLVIPVKGQHTPMRGWRSRVDRQLEPVWNFGYRFQVDGEQSQTVTFAVADNYEE